MSVTARSRRGNRAARAGVAAAVLVLASLGVAEPSYATPLGMEFSTDGITYSPSLTGPLFNGIALLVPGDSQSASFWVRNVSGSAGYLRVVLSDVIASSTVIADEITVRSSTPATIGTAVPLSSAAPCRVLVEGDFVPSGSAVKVTATLALGNLTGTAGQKDTASMSLGIGMSDAAVGSLPPTSCNGASTILPVSGDPVALAYTGSDIPYRVIALSAGALGVGLFLLVAARRRRREDA